MKEAFPSAKDHQLCLCLECGHLLRLGKGKEAFCPRCDAAVNHRKPESVSRTMALVIAAAILYLPANLLPVMITDSIGGIRKDTIFSGIVSLWTSGSWAIAAVVFIASIIIPLLKILVLGVLLYCIQRRPGWQPEQLTRLYRLLVLIGRWSMLDIYVVSLLGALVQFPLVARVSAGPAAVPFAAVVVLTMLAAMQFDPRLIWDGCDQGGRKHAKVG